VRFSSRFGISPDNPAVALFHSVFAAARAGRELLHRTGASGSMGGGELRCTLLVCTLL
jgi:hypothetical protein